MQKSITMKEQEQRNRFDRLCLILHNAQLESCGNVYSHPVSVSDYTTSLDSLAVRPRALISSVELRKLLEEFDMCYLNSKGRLVIS